MDTSLQEQLLLEKVIDPNSKEYQDLMYKLLSPPSDGKAVADRIGGKTEFKYTLPYRGDADVEAVVSAMLPIRFLEKAPYRNGVASLALTAADVLDLIAQASSRRRMTATLLVSADAQSLLETVYAAGAHSTLITYCENVNLVHQYHQMVDKMETMIVDHTTVNIPIDKLLDFAYKTGARVVDGVFPYHVAATRGWDVVAGVGKWSYTHTKTHISVGPDDDASRILRYKRTDYAKFTDPSLWVGKARQYLYEIRKCANGLATYRAVYVGPNVGDPNDVVMNSNAVELQQESFKLPMCTSDDMVLLTINRELAAGVYASGSNNARDLSHLNKDYAIEVRRELFESAVVYLIALNKESDIIGESIRYIYNHNYVDLMDGVRVVRCQSLSYADALCVAMVATLTAYMYRYKLTNKSLGVITRARNVASRSDPDYGVLGRLVGMFWDYIYTRESITARVLERAVDLFKSADYIPGVCYDVYVDIHYQPQAEWYEAKTMEVAHKDRHVDVGDVDPFATLHGGNVAAYAPTVLTVNEKSGSRVTGVEVPYQANVVTDPVAVVQDFYDTVLPEVSVAQLANVAELRRVRDVNINTEFHGKIEVNKDIAAPEQLHSDMPIRTAALPVSRTPLLDAIMASAKRNFNPPDLQLQSAVFSYAKMLVEEFIDNAFVPGYSDTLRKAYEKDPITFNLTDYIEWLSNKDGSYRSALESEVPGEIVELELERFDTIVKRRVKPKLSAAAKFELAQPQVIVSLSKKDTAPFTSVFRQIFERFDNALKPQYKSAGRLSDADISEWLTDNMPMVSLLQAVEIDSGKYDKSQNLLARTIEAEMQIALGLDPNVLDIFADTYVGRVSSKTLGLVFVSAYQMKSGAPQTMLGNLIYNFVSAGRAIGYTNIAYMIAKGDDNVVWLRSNVDSSLVVSKMSNLFNLECKLIKNSVICFSSGYFVFFDGLGYFVPDPLKMADLLGEAGVDVRTLREQFVSFGSRVESLTLNRDIPEKLQALVRLRTGVGNAPVVSLIDALVAISKSFGLYFHIKTGSMWSGSLK